METPRNFDYPEPAQGRMIKQQLARMALDAISFYRTLRDNDRLPAWVLLKVNTAEDRLRLATDYIRYKANPSLEAFGEAPVVVSQKIDGERYLCASEDVERRVAQPIRAATALVVGPLIIYAATKVDNKALRNAVLLSGAAMSLWSAWLWRKADKALQ
jgi:hypothetical protein